MEKYKPRQDIHSFTVPRLLSLALRIKREPHSRGASLVAQRVECLSAMWETQVQSLGREDPLEKEMATLSSILAWRIPWTEVDYSPRGRKESDTTERLHFHFPLQGSQGWPVSDLSYCSFLTLPPCYSLVEHLPYFYLWFCFHVYLFSLSFPLDPKCFNDSDLV